MEDTVSPFWRFRKEPRVATHIHWNGCRARALCWRGLSLPQVAFHAKSQVSLGENFKKVFLPLVPPSVCCIHKWPWICSQPCRAWQSSESAGCFLNVPVPDPLSPGRCAGGKQSWVMGPALLWRWQQVLCWGPSHMHTLPITRLGLNLKEGSIIYIKLLTVHEFSFLEVQVAPSL